MQIQHTLSPAYQQHAAEVLQQIKDAEEQILNFEGHIRRLETRIANMRTHLSVMIGVVEKAEALPESTTPYALSADGTALIGEMDVADVQPSPAEPVVTDTTTEAPNGLAG